MPSPPEPTRNAAATWRPRWLGPPPGTLGANVRRRPRLSHTGEHNAADTARYRGRGRGAHLNGLRSGDQRAYRTQSRRECSRPAHVSGSTDPPTEDCGGGLIDQRPDARELDLEPCAPDRLDTGVRGPRL